MPASKSNYSIENADILDSVIQEGNNNEAHIDKNTYNNYIKVFNALNITYGTSAMNADIETKNDNYSGGYNIEKIESCITLLPSFNNLKPIEQRNVLNIVKEALSILESQNKTNNESEEQETDKVKDDWILRFFDISEKICDKEIQVIFSKILADEIRKPNSYSIRTLDALKNLSSEEAKIFVKLANYVLRQGPHYFLFAENDMFKYMNIKLEDLLKLESAGLITTFPHDYKAYTADDKIINFKYAEKVIGFRIKKHSDNYNFKLFVLTNQAIELLNVVQNIKLDMNYLTGLKEVFNDFTIELYDIFVDKQTGNSFLINKKEL